MRLRKNKSLIERAMDTTRDKASDAVDAALPIIESAVTTAREQVRELSKDAAEKAGPLLTETRLLAGEIAEATREVAIPKARAGAAQAAAHAADLAASGRDLAAAKVAEAKGEPEQKKSHRVRKVLLFGSLAALGGFIYQKLRAGKETDNWQSSYTPPATTTASTTAAPPAPSGGAHVANAPVEEPAEDPTGASPDEALADAAEEPHPVTTPDEPADVVDVGADEASEAPKN
jgi:hypothetical protein